MIVIGDTSGLVAAFNSADPEHGGARGVAAGGADHRLSTRVAGSRTHHHPNLNRQAAYALNDWLLAQERTGRIELPTVSADLLRVA
jgi:hypothetical protein